MQNQTQPQSSQDAFNRVWQHFVVEKNPPSREMTKGCRYRIVSDKLPMNGCAIGCMLPDNLYTAEIEGRLCKTLLIDFYDIGQWFSKVNRDFLINLQRAHDKAAESVRFDVNYAAGYRYDQPFIDNVTHNLKFVANEYKLTIPESV